MAICIAHAAARAPPSRTTARHLHVTGEAHYTDDMPEPRGTLHAAVGVLRARACADRAIDLAEVRAAPGVVAVVTAADIPGVNDVGPIHARRSDLRDDAGPVRGQPVFAVAARSYVEARAAARLASIDFEPCPRSSPSTTRWRRSRSCCRRAPRARRSARRARHGAASARRARVRIGGQDHFYLEGQIALRRAARARRRCRSTAPRSIRAKCSTWSRTRSASRRTTSSSNAGAWAAASAARKRRCRSSRASPRCSRARPGAPVKLRLDRDDDMRSTGKRHAFAYRVRRRLRRRRPHPRPRPHARRRAAASRPTCPGPVNDRAVFHCDNAYWLPDVASCSLPLQDQHGVGHRVPRLRRPAGHVRDRARDRRDRARARPRSARRARGQSLRHDRAQRHALRHDDRGQHRCRDIIAELEDSADYRERRARDRAVESRRAR